MNRRLFPTRRLPPLREIELARQNLPREDTQPSWISRLRASQARRENRRTLENKPRDLLDEVPGSIEHVPCRFCSQLVSVSTYDQHLINCPDKNENQDENIRELPDLSFEDSQRQPDEETNDELDQPQTIQPFPDHSIYHPLEEIPEDIQNQSDSFEEPSAQPMMPEVQDRPSRHPFSFFSNLFGSPADNQVADSHSTQSSITEEPNLPNNNAQVEENIPQNQENQLVPAENGTGRLPHGAFVVRTIETGPTGSTIVRMRVIPLHDVFGQQEENEEGIEREQPSILGLLSLLAGLQGIRAAHFGDFLSLFHEERGLDKEVLESLPVVKFNAEGFKNVDDESKRCTICLDHYEEEQEVKFLWCLHRFHKNCVDQWLDKHTNCPFCKKDYSEALRNYE